MGPLFRGDPTVLFAERVARAHGSGDSGGEQLARGGSWNCRAQALGADQGYRVLLGSNPPGKQTNDSGKHCGQQRPVSRLGYLVAVSRPW